ncbi:LysR substrate-binding domain-containing protein [Sphingomonas solaris]|nr:LysR substrate-binding domain-containing protein [Sphingomonas solaris]
MDLRHMRHFVAVAEELHFGRAARRLNIAQPPLSQSIRRLEVDLGVELFDRSRRSVELTSAGRVFLDEARRTLMHADLARKMAQREAQKAPEVRVSFVGPALYRVLPDLLVRYRATAPEVNVRLFEMSSPDQMHGIMAGDFDVGFITGGTALDGALRRVLMERAPFVAAVPADSPLAEQTSISLAALAEQPFIRPPQKYAAQSSETMSMFRDVGAIPQVTQEATQTNTTLSLVGVGLGCSIVTATAALTQPRNVKFLEIEDPAPHARWELVMAWHPDQVGRIAADFVAIGQAYARDDAHLLETPKRPG